MSNIRRMLMAAAGNGANAPVYESITLTTNSSGSDIVIDMPATRPDDDLYVAIVAQANTLSTWQTIPSNWTPFDHYFGGTGNPKMSGYWWVGDSEPSTYTVSSNSTNFQKVFIIRISYPQGVPDNPIESRVTGWTGFAVKTSPSLDTLTDEPLVIRSVYADLSTTIGTMTGHTIIQSDSFTGVSTLDSPPSPPGSTGTAQWGSATNTQSIHLNVAVGEYTPPADGTHRYWRLKFLGADHTNGSGQSTIMNQVELHDSLGSEDTETCDANSLVAGLYESGTFIQTSGTTTKNFNFVGEELTDGDESSKNTVDTDSNDIYVCFDFGEGGEIEPTYVRVAYDRNNKGHSDVTVGYSDNGKDWTESDKLALGALGTREFSANNYVEITWP